MVKIIRDGNRRNRFYTFECRDCGCVWETDEYHKSYDGTLTLYVVTSKCPTCRRPCAGKNTNKDAWYKLFEEV